MEGGCRARGSGFGFEKGMTWEEGWERVMRGRGRWRGLWWSRRKEGDVGGVGGEGMFSLENVNE